MKIFELEDDIQFTQAMNAIQKKCTVAIDAYKKTGKFLFRGIKGVDAVAFRGKSQSNRLPLQVPPKVQIYIDERLAAAGFKALRSNSIFCSENYGQSNYYGYVYIIFPVDGFDITYSTKYFDIIDIDNSDYDKLFKMPSEPKKFINAMGFKKDNLVNAIKSGNEILINGQYIAAAYDHYADRIRKYLGMPQI